jgi:hypothetical protein
MPGLSTLDKTIILCYYYMLFYKGKSALENS